MSDYDPVEAAVACRRGVPHGGRLPSRRSKAADSLGLKQARLAHAGDRSPIALANREIGALPPAARAESDKRVGTARRAINEALAARQAELEAERDARVLVEETVDVTPAVGPAAARRPPPADHLAGAHRRRVRRHGLRSGRGPRLESEWFNFDALNIAKDHPARSRHDTFYVAAPSRRLRHGAAHADLAGADPRAAPARAAGLRDLAAAERSAPTSSTRPTPPVFHQTEGWPWTRA